MAVTRVTKIRGDTWERDENGPVLVERYLVYCGLTDTPLVCDGAVDPNTGLAVPDHDAEHDDDETMKVTSAKASRWETDNNNCFLVVVTFKSDTTTETKPADATKWNKKVTGGGAEVVERVNKNVDGEPIRNSYGDLYSADFENVKYDEVITVSFDTDDSSIPQAFGEARGRVNDAEVTLNITRHGRTFSKSYPAHTLKLGNATWDIDVGPDGDGFWHVTIPLIHRHQLDADGNEIGWKFNIPDRGYRYLNDSGQTIKSEQLVDLDGEGKKLPAGELQEMFVEELIETTDFMAFLEGV